MNDTHAEIDLCALESIAGREAKARADDWLRHHPADDPRAVSERFLAEARRELDLQ